MNHRMRSSLPQFRELRDEVDRLFSNLVAHPTVAGATRFVTGREFPSVNLWEDNDNVYAECELPGVRSEDLDISVVGNELTIKGRRAETAEPQRRVDRPAPAVVIVAGVSPSGDDHEGHRVEKPEHCPGRGGP